MPVIKGGALVDDPWVSLVDLDANAEVPANVPVIVNLEQWKVRRDELCGRDTPVGVLLRAGQSPEEIADCLGELALVALEIPTFKDGRVFSYARLLRERFGFEGEVRAVGSYIGEQFQFLERCGVDAFQVESEAELELYRTVMEEMRVFYQPTGDGRKTAMKQRHGR